MKVIVAGSTGLIGGGAMKALLSMPSVTSVVALSRRELPTKDPKLETVIIKDFKNYDDSVMSKLADAEGCVWALGTPTGGKEVHHDYTFAAADAFAQQLLPKLRDQRKKFRFVYVSGALVEADANKSMWIMAEARRMRGGVENKIVEYQDQHGPTWETFVGRPMFVTSGAPLWRFLAPNSYIPVEDLGLALADLAVNGNNDKQRLENSDLVRRAQVAKSRGKL